MTQIDPKQELARLRARYAGMNDLELQKVGGDPQTLTEWAQSTLREEMAKRGLDWPMLAGSASGEGEATDQPGSEISKPFVLRQYRDLTAAMVDRSTLESTGIECFLYDDNLIRMDWFISNALGGVKLVVSEKDAEEADKILSEALPAETTDQP